MNKHFFSRMAISNIKKNKRMYLPFMLTAVFMTTMLYIIYSLLQNPSLENVVCGQVLKDFLFYGQWIVVLFICIFLFYTFSFLFKTRKKEFGLYNVFGMGKKDIAKILAIETLIVFLTSVILGILLGILLDKLVFLFILKLLRADVVFGFYFSSEGIIKSIVFIGIIFLLIYISCIIKLYFLNGIELLHGSNRGEREPKTKMAMTIIGILSLGTGYYIALTTYNIVKAMDFFFIAVILVIIGTYLLFVAGSISLLKALKRNKKYYYKPSHFISISSMIYRMKQNAVGFANICIMSTMVLVMLASTFTLWVGVNKTSERMYPKDICMTIYADKDEDLASEMAKNLEEVLKEENISFSNQRIFETANRVVVLTDGVAYITPDSEMTLDANNFNEATEFDVIKASDYKEKKISLNDGEVAILGTSDYTYDKDKIFINGKEYKVKKLKDNKCEPIRNPIKAIGNGACVVVVKDEKTFLEFCDAQEYAGTWCYTADSDMTYEQGEKVEPLFSEKLVERTDSFGYSLDIKVVYKEEKKAIYGGLLFVGIFLSILFILGMILTIYYKQISEGYDDRNRYQIMQKVGLDDNEIRRTIKSQVKTVFFSPLIVAGCHVFVAFPIINRILNAFGLNGFNLYLSVMVTTFVTFALFYMIVYMLTSRAYYKIIK